MSWKANIGATGDHVRPLTRPEAGALAAEIQSAKPEDKAARIAGLQDLYGARFENGVRLAQLRGRAARSEGAFRTGSTLLTGFGDFKRFS